MAANPGRGVGVDGGGVDPVGIDPDRGEAGSARRRDQVGRREIPAAVGGQSKLHSRRTLLRVEHGADASPSAGKRSQRSEPTGARAVEARAGADPVAGEWYGRKTACHRRMPSAGAQKARRRRSADRWRRGRQQLRRTSASRTRTRRTNLSDQSLRGQLSQRWAPVRAQRPTVGCAARWRAPARAALLTDSTVVSSIVGPQLVSTEIRGRRASVNTPRSWRRGSNLKSADERQGDGCGLAHSGPRGPSGTWIARLEERVEDHGVERMRISPNRVGSARVQPLACPTPW